MLPTSTSTYSSTGTPSLSNRSASPRFLASSSRSTTDTTPAKFHLNSSNATMSTRLSAGGTKTFLRRLSRWPQMVSDKSRSL